MIKLSNANASKQKYVRKNFCSEMKTISYEKLREKLETEIQGMRMKQKTAVEVLGSNQNATLALPALL